MDDFPILDPNPLPVTAEEQIDPAWSRFLWERAEFLRRTPELSPRLREMAAMVAAGMEYKEIGKKLGVKGTTIKVRMSAEVFPVFGVTNRWEFTRYWMDHIEERGDCRKCMLRMAHDAARVG